MLCLSENCREIEEFTCSYLKQASTYAEIDRLEWNIALIRFIINSSRLTTLNISNTQFYFDHEFFTAFTGRNLNCVSTKIIQRRDNFDFACKSVFNIAMVSDNLISLNLSLTVLTPVFIDQICNSGIETITELEIDCSVAVGCLERNLIAVFQRNRKIRTFAISNAAKENFTGECILHLRKEFVVEIILKNCYPDLKYYIAQGMPAFCNLKKFHVSVRTRQDYENIVECLASLELQLRYLELQTEVSFNAELAEVIGKLKNLQVLSLQGLDFCNIGKNFFVSLAENLTELRSLYVYGFNDIFESSIESIDVLPNFQELTVVSGSCKSRVRQALRWMNQLRTLYLDEYKEIQRAHEIEVFLKHSVGLQRMTVCHCGSICHKIINSAIKETRKRKNNLTLELVMLHEDISQLDWNLVKGSSPFLRLI